MLMKENAEKSVGRSSSNDLVFDRKVALVIDEEVFIRSSAGIYGVEFVKGSITITILLSESINVLNKLRVNYM